MFETHPPFKHLIQFNEKSTYWTAVELTDQTPWFLATVLDSTELIERKFLLSREDEVLLFAREAPLGKLTALHLIQSPAWSQTGDWAVVPIRRVDQKRRANVNFVTMVVTDHDGVQYGGLPVERLKGDAGNLELLVEMNEQKKHA